MAKRFYLFSAEKFKDRVRESPGMYPVFRITETDVITGETRVIDPRYTPTHDAGQYITGHTLQKSKAPRIGHVVTSVVKVFLLGHYNTETGKFHKLKLNH